MSLAYFPILKDNPKVCYLEAKYKEGKTACEERTLWSQRKAQNISEMFKSTCPNMENQSL